MKKQSLSMLVVGLMFVVGCGTDEISAPTAPSSPTSESEFPVSADFPGLETEIATSEKPTGDLVDTAISAGFKTLVAAVQAAQLEGASMADLLVPEPPQELGIVDRDIGLEPAPVGDQRLGDARVAARRAGADDVVDVD